MDTNISVENTNTLENTKIFKTISSSIDVSYSLISYNVIEFIQSQFFSLSSNTK